MQSQHFFHLDKTAPQHVRPAGWRIDVGSHEFPVLQDMAISRLHIRPKAFREPHWHPNAHELGYCLKGKGLITIFSPGAGHDTFTIEPGTVSFIPMGYLHDIENISDEPLEMLLCFNNTEPEHLQLSTSVSIMPDHILGATFGTEASFFSGLTNSIHPVFISELDAPRKLENSWATNRFKLQLDRIPPQIQTKGGAVILGSAKLLPTLEDLALFKLILEKGGIREPHWHPNAHELNYLIDGRARIILLSPDGNVETFEMEAGDISFLPRGYLHSIENIGPGKANFAIYFNHVTPSDIGLSGCLGAYSNKLLAALFKVPPTYFDSLTKYQEDLFVVAGGG